MKGRPGIKWKTSDSRIRVETDRGLESKQRMGWIEEGGIDLRAARDAATFAAMQRLPKPHS